MGEARHTPDDDLELLLEAADLKTSDARLDSLRDEFLAIAASAKDIAAVVASSPQTTPFVVPGSLWRGQGRHR